jgi:hypothetical protein
MLQNWNIFSLGWLDLCQVIIFSGDESLHKHLAYSNVQYCENQLLKYRKNANTGQKIDR